MATNYIHIRTETENIQTRTATPSTNVNLQHHAASIQTEESKANTDVPEKDDKDKCILS